MRFTSLAAATALSASTLAAQINITLLLTPLLANPSQLSASTSATLTGAVKEYTSHLDTKLGFTFPDVPTGTYLLDVNAPGPEGFVFAPLRIDVVKPSEEIEGGALPASGSKRDVGDKVEDDREVVLAWGTWRGNEWTNKGEVVEAMEWNGVGGGKSFGIKAVGKREYLVDRQGCEFHLIPSSLIYMCSLVANILQGHHSLSSRTQ